jgi:hypothetical protein
VREREEAARGRRRGEELRARGSHGDLEVGAGPRMASKVYAASPASSSAPAGARSAEGAKRVRPRSPVRDPPRPEPQTANADLEPPKDLDPGTDAAPPRHRPTSR